MDFTAANVERAVLQFYFQGFLNQEVHQWLSAAQYSPAAWSFSWELIQPTKSVEVQFFGASCLHVRIARFWHELPPDQYQTLKQQVIEKIAQFAKGPRIVLTRLCIVLSSLVLHLTPEHWPDAIQSLITMFQQDNPDLDSTQRCHLLLEILTVLPEEFTSSTMSQYKKCAVRNELEQALPKVMCLVQSLLNMSLPTRVLEQALKSVGSWSEFGFHPQPMEPILELVLRFLHQTETFDAAVDTLVKVLNHPDLRQYPETLQKLFVQILGLQDMYNKALQEKDMETVQGLCRILVSAGENNTKVLLNMLKEGGNNRAFSLAFIHTIIKMAFPPGQFPIDETVSDMSFTFWYMLQDDLFECEDEEYKMMAVIFQPMYYELIQVLLTKVEYPEEQEFESWTKDEQEAFRCFRQDIGDTMMYCFNVVREPVLGYFCQRLQILIEASKTQQVRWQSVEGIFFMIGSMAECVDLEETIHLPVLMSMVPSFHFNNITLLSTALYMIGSFGEWMNSHPEILSCVLPLVLQGLENSKVGTAATMALKDITRESLDHIRPFIPQILSTSQMILQKEILLERDAMRLMACVGQVLSVLPIPDIMSYLDAILVPRLQHLQHLVRQEPSDAVQKQLVFQIQLLSWLFSTLDTEKDGEGHDNAQPPHPPSPSSPKPVFVVMQQILPTVQELVSKWKMQPAVVEVVNEMFKKSLVVLMDDFKSLANSVATMMIEMYETTPHASILDVARQIVLLFGFDADFTHYVNTLLNVICNKTLQPFPAVLPNTDVVEAFMIFMANLLKKMKPALVQSGVNLEAILKAGLVTMSLSEHGVVKASCFLVIEFLNAGSEEQSIRSIVNNNMQLIVDRVMRAIGGESARQTMEIMSDVLLSCCKFHFPVLDTTLRACLDTEGYPSPRALPQDKENFLKSIISNKTNKRKMRDIVKEFSLLCRGLLGTDYVEVAKQLL
ncbi:importin-13-like [Babylonia areolata]|uniref:importin-13-like n=1 Tax=Babylonia areolata TaxID=304850 RepID=UPI003FCF7534